MSDTIERIMVTFFDVIYSSNKEWTEIDIHQQLLEKGYNVSRAQLNRDLNRYHHYFCVERLDKDNSNKTKPAYRRKQSRFGEARMSDGEFHFLTALLTIKEHVRQHLPPEAENYLDIKMQSLITQRNMLQRSVPQHPLFSFEKNLELLTKCEAEGKVAVNLINELRFALTKQKDIFIVSCEYGTENADCLSPIKVYECCGEFYVSGMSKREGGTNFSYCLSKMLYASCSHDFTQTVVPNLTRAL